MVAPTNGSLRTAKSCGPDTPMLVSCAMRASVLLHMVANKPGAPGRPRISRSNRCAGKAGRVRPDLWYLPPAFFSQAGHGRGQRSAFPAPSISIEGGPDAQLGRDAPRERDVASVEADRTRIVGVAKSTTLMVRSAACGASRTMRPGSLEMIGQTGRNSVVSPGPHNAPAASVNHLLTMARARSPRRIARGRPPDNPEDTPWLSPGPCRCRAWQRPGGRLQRFRGRDCVRPRSSPALPARRHQP